MGLTKVWFSLALSFVAIAAAKDEGSPEPPIEPFRAEGSPEPPIEPFRMGDTTDFPPGVVFKDDQLIITKKWNDKEETFDEEDEEDMFDADEDEYMDNIMPDFMDTNPKEINRQPVFEADILLTPEQRQALNARKGLASAVYRWPEGSDGYPLIPYVFTSGSLDTATITAGMNHWMEHTCLKFEQTTNFNQPHIKYIYGGGCYSYMGKVSNSGQDVSIGRGCNSLGIVAHEIGHAIGFAHEQSRPDRDDYVVVNLENIYDSMEGNFNKYSTSYINNQNIEYDYSSDMHYGSTGFSINGKTTLATKDPLLQGLIGQRAGLSHRDKRLANIMYGCIDKWLNKCGEASDTCQNGGYFGANCACVCPPGTSGSSCETTTGGYYDSFINSCSEKITKPGTISSPNFPSKSPGKCVKIIEAPECNLPKLTFSGFQLYPRNAYCTGGVNCCYFDALEIRTTNRYSGDVYCATDISSGSSFTGTSREMILFYRAATPYYTGFSAELTFEPQEGCQTTTEAPATTQAPATTTTTQAPATTTQAPATTTTEQQANCVLQYMNGAYYWSSPNFGNSNYPNNFSCGIRGGSNTAYAVKIRLQNFNLQGKVDDGCKDSVKLTREYGRTKTFCGRRRKPKTLSLPSLTFGMQFTSDEGITRPGYNISITLSTTECHQTLTPAAGESGTITVPKEYLSCHYRIMGPSGTEIRIDQVTTKIRRSRNCIKDWMLLNGSGDSAYPKDTSSILCGWGTVQSPMTSTAGQMLVAYKGSSRSRGFELKYTVI